MNWSPRSQKAKGLTRLWKLPPSTKLCKDFYVLDIETAFRPNHNKIFKDSSTYKGELHWQLEATQRSFVFGVIYGHNYTKICHSVYEMQTELLQPRFRNKNVFAHNGGNFDYPGIFGNIYEYDNEAIFNGKYICHTNGNCTFADSVNIFVGASIAQLGDMFGTKKLGMSNDYGISVWPKDYAKDVNGCIRDCEILWDALFSVFEFSGEIRITQASLSLCYYRRFHQPFHIDHNENTKHFWGSYYGGRTEVFKLGKTHSSVIDVNSMYPFHLRNAIFPNPKTLKHEIELPVKILPKYLKWFEGCADCTIVHSEISIGYLPFKDKSGKLIFPTGTFRGCWNFPELRFALKHKVIKILTVHSITYGEPMQSPFVSYVDTLWTMKNNAKVSGNVMEEDRAKRFANSLYGKFGQRIEEETIYIKDINKQWNIIQEYQQKRLYKDLITFGKNRNDAMLVIGSRKKHYTPYAIPSFASYVTTYGRLQLLEKMLAMWPNKIVYCDTDSIFLEVANGVKSESQLGGWKLEDKIITEIKGLKNYRYIDYSKPQPKEVWRVKGVPVNKGKTTKLLSPSGGGTGKVSVRVIPFVEQIGENTFRYFNLMKTKEGLRRNRESGVLTERIKEIKNTYDKRIIFKDGNTKPINIKPNEKQDQKVNRQRTYQKA